MHKSHLRKGPQARAFFILDLARRILYTPIHKSASTCLEVRHSNMLLKAPTGLMHPVGSELSAQSSHISILGKEGIDQWVISRLRWSGASKLRLETKTYKTTQQYYNQLVSPGDGTTGKPFLTTRGDVCAPPLFNSLLFKIDMIK